MIKSKEATKKNCLYPLCLLVQIYCDSPTQLKTMESEEVIEKNKLNKFAITLLLICSNLLTPPPQPSKNNGIRRGYRKNNNPP